MDMDFAKNVGYAFIKEYYGKVGGRSAADLCHMYSKESTFMRFQKDEATVKVAAYGVDSIRNHLANIPKTKFALANVDCCPSVHGSILISVEGTAMTESSSCDFHQTFIISPNAYISDTYYIHNDLMRMCSEEVSHQTEAAAPAPPVPPSPPAPPAQPAYTQPSPPPVEDIATIEPSQVEHEIINNVIDEVMDDKEDTELPVVDLISKSITEREAPEEPAQEEEEEEPVQEEDKEELDSAPKSYASVLARMKATEVKTQVLSGGSVPNAAKQKRKEPERKKPVGDIVALNLISSVRANGKGTKGAKGSKGGKDANNRGQAKKEEEKKFVPHVNSLYIRNLPKDFSEDDCEKVFGVFGKLTGKTIRAAEGYAFIDYDTKASMEKALAQPVTFNSISLNVQEKKSHAQRTKEKEEASRNRATKRVQRN